jgi:hypothetical protein
LSAAEEEEGVRRFWKRRTLGICVCFALATAIVPLARACFRLEVDYNEGWNVYNASIVADHGLLYPVKYGWTTVNYPMLSFVLLAQLHRLTGEYLFTARVLSLAGLMGCCVLVGAIVRQLGGSVVASRMAGLYCFAMFCADASLYVGMDDPQMFAQVFFLLGLWVYLWRRESLPALAGAALLFVVGGFIKHNPIDFPLAVLVELGLVSRWRALWFSGWGLGLVGVAVWLNIHYGGPYFLSQLLAPRAYVGGKVVEQFLNVFGPLLLPFWVALSMAFVLRKQARRRVATILLAATLVVGGYFGGGQGVTINCLFTAMLASAILIGLFFDEVASGRWRWAGRRWAVHVPLVLFGWLAIPLIVWGNWNVVGRLREAAAAERRFDVAVETLRDRPGPAMCESLLLCHYAGKGYVYDPFNATRLIHFGKLDAGVVVEDLRRQRYAAIQLDGPAAGYKDSERFAAAIVAAVEENYVPALTLEDTVIYVPKMD